MTASPVGTAGGVQSGVASSAAARFCGITLAVMREGFYRPSDRHGPCHDAPVADGRDAVAPREMGVVLAGVGDEGVADDIRPRDREKDVELP